MLSDLLVLTGGFTLGFLFLAMLLLAWGDEIGFRIHRRRKRK